MLNTINEAEAPRYSTKTELALKKKLIALLKDDGNGHHHSKYAEYLKQFDIRIIFLSVDPKYTASMDFEHGIIRIGEGFLNNEKDFFQLNVLLRHELAHALLKHEIRMMHKIVTKYGKTGHTHIRMSQSLHRLDNIIMDYEISNTRYTKEDKEIVKNMRLNGQIIGGLVTEFHRSTWVNLSVEDMYDRLTEEIQQISENLRSGRTWRNDENDFITRELLAVQREYGNTDSPSAFEKPLSKVIKSTSFARWIPSIKDIVIAINDYNEEHKANTNDADYSEDEVADIQKQIIKIADSGIRDSVDIIAPNSGEVLCTVYTPEEKFIAIEALKTLIKNTVYDDSYDIWYKKVNDTLNTKTYNEADLKKIFANLK